MAPQLSQRPLTALTTTNTVAMTRTRATADVMKRPNVPWEERLRASCGSGCLIASEVRGVSARRAVPGWCPRASYDRTFDLRYRAVRLGGSNRADLVAGILALTR
jgi:hypothetical protein